jgi:hypothetical protein
LRAYHDAARQSASFEMLTVHPDRHTPKSLIAL